MNSAQLIALLRPRFLALNIPKEWKGLLVDVPIATTPVDYVDLALCHTFNMQASLIAPSEEAKAEIHTWIGFADEDIRINIKFLAQNKALWGDLALTPAMFRWFDREFCRNMISNCILMSPRHLLPGELAKLDFSSNGVPTLDVSLAENGFRAYSAASRPKDRALVHIFTMLQLALLHYVDGNGDKLLALKPIRYTEPEQPLQVVTS